MWNQFRAPHAIDATFSSRPCRLDGVEAHEGPITDSLVDSTRSGVIRGEPRLADVRVELQQKQHAVIGDVLDALAHLEDLAENKQSGRDSSRSY